MSQTYPDLSTLADRLAARTEKLKSAIAGVDLLVSDLRAVAKIHAEPCEILAVMIEARNLLVLSDAKDAPAFKALIELVDRLRRP